MTDRYATYKHLKVEIDGDRIATVTLNRPENRNAMNKTLIRECQRIWVDLSDDPRVNAILITGAGSHFSVGGDVKQMSERPGGDFLDEGEQWDPVVSRRMVNNMLELEKPVIAALNGDCVGLACTMALFCDIQVMSADARIGDPHVRIGLVAGDGGAVIWPLLVGMSRAKEFLMRGTLLKGPDAERLGLVNYCVPKADVMAKAREIALDLAQGAPMAVRWTKMALNAVIKQAALLVQPAAHAYEHLTIESADHKEAATAFKEKRKATFKGR